MPETRWNRTPDLSWSLKIRNVAKKISCTDFRASSIYEAGAVARQRPDLVQNTHFEIRRGKLWLFNDATIACRATRMRLLGFFGEPYSSHNDTKYPVRQVGPSPDYTAVRAWLEHCRSNHTECDVGGKFDLRDIYLIDVNTRVLVKYPPEAEYVILSYVWGKTAAPHFNRNAILPENLPRTIDHAITATRHLGFSYIWIDALCIDQANHADKKHQISLMDQIYEASVATLVALDGADAESGLGGVGQDCPRIPQLFAQFGPYEALSRCPKFNAELEISVWSERGWTFQEAVLSRRCVFFTRHQVYYRCESMFCSEDYHDQENFGFLKTDSFIISQLDSPFTPKNKPSLQYTGPRSDMRHEEDEDMYMKYDPLFRDYVELLTSYNDRKLSDKGDRINAFSAILNRLEKKSLPGKFFGGLPLDLMRQALQWNSLYANCGVRVQSSNSHLPSWSWAAWKPKHLSILHRNAFIFGAVQPPLRIWTFDGIIHCNGCMIPDINTKKEHINIVELEHPVASSKNIWIQYSKNPNMSSSTDDWNKDSVPEAAIFVEAILVTFHKRNLHIEESVSTIRLYGVDGSSEITDYLGQAENCSPNIIEFLQMKDSYDFIVLANHLYDRISLILLDWKDGMAIREGLMELEFKSLFESPNIPEILGLFDMRVARFWWV